MVIWAKEDTLEQFMPLIPEEMQFPVRNGDWFCLGALAEPDEDSDMEERTAAGVLLFSPEEEVNNDGEQMTMIVLHWIYVADEYRINGLANELMDALSDALEDSDAQAIICDVPFGSEYDLTEAFFISWGFQFRVIDSHEMIVSKDDCRRLYGSTKHGKNTVELAREIPEGVVSVYDIPEDTFKAAIQRAKDAEKSGYFDNIPETREAYAGDMSYAVMRDGGISSIILFERIVGGDLKSVLLTSFDSKREKELMTLMMYTAGYYYLNYPENTRIHFGIEIDKDRKLAMHFFQDVEPVPIRRGIFSETD